MRARLAQVLIFGVIFFLAAAGCRRSNGRPDMEKSNRQETLKVLTYNLWHGLNPTNDIRFQEYESEGEREARLQGFLTQARELDPDVIFLQEVNPAPSKARRIARELGMDGAWVIDNAGLKIGSFGIPTNLRSGLAILAKKGLRLKDLGGRKLSGPFGWTGRSFCFQTAEFRYALAAGIELSGRRVLLLNTHLHHGPEVTEATKEAMNDLAGAGAITRERAREILARIDRASDRRRREMEAALAFAADLGFADAPTIFAGDFNASPDAREITWLKKVQGFSSATADDDPAEFLITWDWQRNPNTHFIEEFKPVDVFEEAVNSRLAALETGLSRRIDYIFTRPAGFATAEDSGLFGDKPHRGRMCSDHFGIWAHFRLAGD